MTTPREMGDLMALIAGGRAVSSEASASMLATLRRQTDKAMIPRLLPAGIDVGNKTGTDSEKLADPRGRLRSIRADAAIVTGPGLQYVVTVYTRRGAPRRARAQTMPHSNLALTSRASSSITSRARRVVRFRASAATLCGAVRRRTQSGFHPHRGCGGRGR